MRVLAIVILCACGAKEQPPEVPPSPGSSATAPKQPVAAPPPPVDAAVAHVAPASSLVQAIPADTPFVFVTLDPLPAPLWLRLRAELDGAELRASAHRAIALSPIRRLRNAALAELGTALASKSGLGSLGFAASPRFAVYGAGLVPVVRVELADPAATQAALERVFTAAGLASARRGPAWIVESGSQALVVAVAGGHLVVARAKPGVDVAPLLGAAATPLDEAALRPLATAGSTGWVDPARIATLAKTPGAIPELDQLAAPCRALVDGMLAKFPRITFGFSEVSATKLALATSFELDADVAALLAEVTASAPTLPDQLEGAPLAAASWATPPYDATVLAPWRAIAAACSDAPKQVLDLSPPWNQVRAGAVALYDVKFGGFVPQQIDAFAALFGPDPAALVATLRKHAPGLASPTDGGAFVPLRFEHMPELGLARRGKLLVIAGGTGKARSSALAMRSAPLFRLVLDLAAIRKRLTPAPGPPKDDDLYRVPEAASDTTIGELVHALGTLEVLATSDPKAVRMQLAVSLPPPSPKQPRPTDPRFAIRDRCVAILRTALHSTVPALAKLGITDELDAIATTYMTSIQATSMVRSCAKLTDAQRACLAKSANPIAGAIACAPRNDHFGGSALELPPLFSFFGPRPLEARLHPPIDGAATRAKLAGTWVRKTSFETETWVIDAAGNVTITEARDGKSTVEKRRIELKRAGKLELHEGNGHSTSAFYMPSADRFFTTGQAVPIAARDRFVAGIGGGWLVRDKTACWVVTDEGLLLDATCKAAGDTLAVAYKPPCDGTHRCERDETFTFHPGFIVDEQLTSSQPFVRSP